MKLKPVTKLVQNKLLLITTIIPTFLATLYFGLVASDVYISESRFVVRSPERQNASPLGLILKGAGFSKAQDDSYAVQDYVLSRDALKALDDELKLKDAYSSSRIDPISRFSGFAWDDSQEAFYQFYLKKVALQLDSTSSISTLTVRAYSPELAQGINKRLVDLAEGLVNKLNERGRQDMIRFAANEVSEAQAKAKAAAFALSQYRNAKGVIDPEKQSTIPLQQVAKLQDELITTKTQVLQLEKLAKDNPQLPVLRQRLSMLDSEIDAESKRIAGGDRSLAGKAAEFQRLALEKEFSDKMLASAMNTLEQARNDAVRKQVYLERIVQSGIPDYPLEPRRLRNIFATLLLGLILYGILSIFVAGVKEHHDR